MISSWAQKKLTIAVRFPIAQRSKPFIASFANQSSAKRVHAKFLGLSMLPPYAVVGACIIHEIYGKSADLVRGLS